MVNMPNPGGVAVHHEADRPGEAGAVDALLHLDPSSGWATSRLMVTPQSSPGLSLEIGTSLRRCSRGARRACRWYATPTSERVTPRSRRPSVRPLIEGSPHLEKTPQKSSKQVTFGVIKCGSKTRRQVLQVCPCVTSITSL